MVVTFIRRRVVTLPLSFFLSLSRRTQQSTLRYVCFNVCVIGLKVEMDVSFLPARFI